MSNGTNSSSWTRAITTHGVSVAASSPPSGTPLVRIRLRTSECRRATTVWVAVT
jgi:hypothetical protein